MEEINYAALLPDQPEEDVVSFARRSGAFGKNYLVYRSDHGFDPLEDRKKEMVRVVCSACGEAFYAEKIKAGGCSRSYVPAPFGWMDHVTGQAVISGDETACPCCGELAKTLHVGNMTLYGGEHVDDAWVSVLSRLPPNDRPGGAHAALDRLVLTDWCVRRCVDKQAKTRYEVWPYTAWVVEEKKIVRLMGYRKNIGGNISLFGRWEERKQFRDVYGKMQFLTPWDPALLEGTTAENSKLDLYLSAGGDHPVGYLALWRKRPQVENLLVQGCGKLVADWIREEEESSYYTGGIPKLAYVNWKEKRPAQMLCLSKEEFRYLRQMGWDEEDLDRYKMVRDRGLPVKLPDDMALLRSVKSYECNLILEEASRADFWRVLRYLRKQRADWRTLRDYWNMARTEGRDLEDSLVRWPRDLKASHARQIQARQEAEARQEAARRAEQIAARASLFKARAEELARLAFTRDGLLIRPCASEDELINEGKVLHHCVASYARDHAGGKTAVLFVRRAEEPDKPFFTLEFDEKNLTVRQNRGLRNCDRTPEVADFEKAWLEWVKAGMKKKARVRDA